MVGNAGLLSAADADAARQRHLTTRRKVGPAGPRTVSPEIGWHEHRGTESAPWPTLQEPGGRELALTCLTRVMAVVSAGPAAPGGDRLNGCNRPARLAAEHS